MVKRMLLLLPMILLGCVSPPEGIKPIVGFDINRYLGTWYEIARLDHSFERGLESVTAHYSLREDGGIKIVNKGFDPKTREWKEAVGKAYFAVDSNTGSLRVSFFGPFYGGYHVLALDKVHYSYALVCGSSRSYLWILARKPVLGESKKAALIKEARSLGFETERLIHVKHFKDRPLSYLRPCSFE
jgi:apolipoprotein D and lipocalin family protein